MPNSLSASRASFFKLLPALGLVLISLHSSSAFADDTKRLFSFVDWLNGVKDQICSLVAPGSPVKAPIAEAPRPAPAKPSNTFKNDRELNRYLECYAVEDGRYEKVAKEYMPIIEAAAKSFGLPKTLLACLMFRESRFNPAAVSHSGAFGLGQHTTQAMNHLTVLIQPMSEKKLQKLKGDAQMTPEEYVKKYPMTRDQAVEDIGVAKTKVINQSLTAEWVSYAREIKKKKLGDVDRISAINHATLKSPLIAIGATAFYLKTIIVHFHDTLDPDLRVSNLDTENPNFDVLLTAAGAYNMGPGVAARILSPIEPPDRKAWIEALKHANEETAKHMLSIERCIQSTRSPDGKAWMGPIGSPRYDCNDGNSSRTPRVQLRSEEELPDEYKNKFKTAQMKQPAPQEIARPKTEKTPGSNGAKRKASKKKKKKEQES